MLRNRRPVGMFEPNPLGPQNKEIHLKKTRFHSFLVVITSYFEGLNIKTFMFPLVLGSKGCYSQT